MNFEGYIITYGKDLLDTEYIPQLDRTKGSLAGDIIITNQCTCHGLGRIQACVLLLTTQQTRHNHISTLDITIMLQCHIVVA